MATETFDPAEYEAQAKAQGESPAGVSLSIAKPGGGAEAPSGGFNPQEYEASASAPGAGGAAGGVVDEATRALRTAGANGLANLLGLPVDTVNLIISANNAAARGIGAVVGVTPGQFPTIETGSREGLKEAGLGAAAGPPPKTATGRIAARAGEEVVTAVGTGAAGKVAGALGALGPLGQRLAAMSVPELVKTEAAVAAASGTGAGVGREVSKNPWVELAGQLLGAFGFAGSMGVLRWAQRNRPPVTAAGAERTVGRFLDQAVPPGSQFEQNLDQGVAASKALPNAGITTGQATGSPILLRATAKLGQTGGGAAGARVAEQPAQATRAIQGATEAAAGVPTGATVADTQAALRGQAAARQASAKATQGTETAAAQAEASQRTAAFRESAAQIQSQVDDLARQAHDEAQAALRSLPTQNREAAGRVITSAIESKSAEVKQAAGRAFDQVPDDIPLDTSELKQAVQQVMSEAGQGLRTREELGRSIPRLDAKLNPEVDEMAAAMSEGSDTRTFGEVRRWRSDLLNEYRQEAAGPAPDQQRVRAIRRVLDATEATLDQAAESSDAYRQASTQYKDYIERFRQGVVGVVMQKGRLGEKLAKPVEDAARQFFKTGGQGGSVTNARAFVAAVGDVPTARQALIGAALDDFAQHVAPNGSVSSKLASRWLDAHRDAITVFPEVGEAVMGVVRRAVKAESATKLASDVQKTLAGKGMKLAGDAAQAALERAGARSVEESEDAAVRLFTGADPESAIGTVLGKPDAVQTARKLVAAVGGEPAAMNGLRRAFLDEMQSATRGATDRTSRSPLLNPEKLGQFLEKKDRKSVV